MAAARALALVRGRDYVIPQDVVEIMPDVLRHRLVLSYDALADEIDADQVIARVLQTVGLPQVGAQPVPQGQYPPGQQHAPNPGHGPNGYAGQQVPQSAGPMDPNSAPANRNSPQYGG